VITVSATATDQADVTADENISTTASQVARQIALLITPGSQSGSAAPLTITAAVAHRVDSYGAVTPTELGNGAVGVGDSQHSHSNRPAI